MVIRMARPSRRKGSSSLQFRQRIPRDVRTKAINTLLVIPVGDAEAAVRIGPRTDTVQFSLRTTDQTEAKAREAIALAHIEAHWKALREGPVALTQKQIVAIAGEVYRETVRSHEDNPGEPEGWEIMHHLAATPVGSGLQIGTAPSPMPSPGIQTVRSGERVLSRHGLSIDDDSRVRLNEQVRIALAKAALRVKGNAEGDYSPDKTAERYPALELNASLRPSRRATGRTITGMLEDWWREAKAARRSLKTYQSYSSSVHSFVALLGHDEADRATNADVIRWKDARLAQGVSPRTVKTNNLVGLRTIFKWGVANGRVSHDPTEGVTVVAQRRIVTRSKAFSMEEAIAILRHSLDQQQGRQHFTTYSAKRWVPWLCAFSGARVGEVAQLRKSDIYRVGSHWVMRITPEAGAVKDGEFREVPLHRQLVGMGFLRFCETTKGPYLFLTPNQSGEIHGVRAALINRLGNFVREVVPDKRVAPNHAWRHTFKTTARGAGVAPETIDAICGHAPANVGASYGETPLKAKIRAIEMLPDFDLE